MGFGKRSSGAISTPLRNTLQTDAINTGSAMRFSASAEPAGVGVGSLISGMGMKTKAGVAGVVFLLLWLTGYFVGIFPWIGYRSASESNFGIGKMTVLGNNKAAFSFGLTMMPLLKGQEFYLNYDANIKSGELFLNLYQKASLKSGHHMSITKSGKGQLVVPITSSGLYKLKMRGMVDNKGKGWDIKYTVSWGARWQKK